MVISLPLLQAGLFHRNTSWKDITVISNLKLRGSWGIIGNDKIPYDKTIFPYPDPGNSVLGNPPTANSAVTYAASGNPKLKWESTKQADAGLEIGLFKDKLTGEFDYYNRVTKRHPDPIVYT